MMEEFVAARAELWNGELGVDWPGVRLQRCQRQVGTAVDFVMMEIAQSNEVLGLV